MYTGIVYLLICEQLQCIIYCNTYHAYDMSQYLVKIQLYIYKAYTQYIVVTAPKDWNICLF